MAKLTPLLSESKAQDILQIFNKVALKSNAPHYHYSPRSVAPMASLVVPVNNDIVAPGAEIIDGPEEPAPSDLEFYRNPKYHLDVLATLAAITMSMVGYVPELTEIPTDAVIQSEGFIRFLNALVSFFPQYVRFATADTIHIENSSSSIDLDPLKLLELVQEFIAKTTVNPKAGACLIQLIKESTHSMTSIETTCYRSALYTSYLFEGREHNPRLTIFWSPVKLQKNKKGKITCVSSELNITRFTVELISNSVIADSAYLAAAPGFRAQEVADSINRSIINVVDQSSKD